MGMFDWVEYAGDCPKCGVLLTEWQSKSGDCTLDWVRPEEVDEFHAYCRECKAMVSFHKPRRISEWVRTWR